MFEILIKVSLLKKKKIELFFPQCICNSVITINRKIYLNIEI